MTVAPLTATVLADADESDAGIASAINNAVARVAGLVGDLGDRRRRREQRWSATRSPPNDESVHAFHEAMVICAALVAAGGVIGLRRDRQPAAHRARGGLRGRPARRRARSCRLT